MPIRIDGPDLTAFVGREVFHAWEAVDYSNDSIEGSRHETGLWTDRGQIATIAAETTAKARTIWALARFDGKLHIGHGDFTRDTGPMRLFSLNLTSHAYTDEAAFASEAVYVFREMNGVLYAANSDFDPNSSTAGVARLEAGGSWTMGAFDPIPAHVYDLCEFDGAFWAACGGSGPTAPTLHRSDDNGLTWPEVYRWEDRDERVTGIAAMNGRLWCNPSSGRFVAEAGPALSSADGVTWTEHPTMLVRSLPLRLPGWITHKPRNYYNGLVYLTAIMRASPLYWYDGTSEPMLLMNGVRDFHVSEVAGVKSLFVLRADGEIFYTSESFSTPPAHPNIPTPLEMIHRASAPKNAKSIYVHDSTEFWVGTADSKVWHAATVPVS